MIAIRPRSRFALAAVVGSFAVVGASMAHATSDAGNEPPKAETPAAAPEAAAPDADAPPAWDQAASIRGAAERLGRLHRVKGAKAAYELIDNCYRTHSLASKYGEGFETCIAQDYLETRTLIEVYSRMPPAALQKAGVPSPRQLAESMGQRVSLAFTRYNKSQAYADNVRKLVDIHGLPVFLSLVFPEAARAMEQKNSKEKQQTK